MILLLRCDQQACATQDSETRVKKAHMASQTMLENTVPSLVKAQRKVLTIGEPCITEQVIEWVEHLEQKDEEVPVAAIHPPSRHAETDPSIWALDDLHKNLHLTSQPLQELCHANGKRERFYDGLRLVWYPNETVKEAYESGRQIIYFKNGDKKQVRFYYAHDDENSSYTVFK